MIYYRDPAGRQIAVAPVENERMGGTTFQVEVIASGEVVDHFALYGQVALDYTARKRGWKEGV